MSFYTGVFNTTVNPAELNKRSFADALLRLFPDGSAPIFALTSQTPKRRAVSSTHGYFTKTLVFASVQIDAGAGYAAGITTFTVDSTTGIVPGMVLYVAATRENIRVATVASATSITVTRSFGRVTATGTIADNTILPVIGYAEAEGSSRPTARGLTTVYVANYTQIFRTAWALTDTARASAAEMGITNIGESRKDCALLHSVDIESALIFGQPKMDTTGTQPLHATQGLIDATEQYAAGNTTTAGGTTSMTQLETMLEPAWTYSHDLGEGKRRMAFAGSLAMKVFNQIARLNGTVQIMPSQTSFGFQFTEFRFYKGSIIMVEHPLLNGISGMTGLCIGVDMPAFRIAYMEGRDTKPEEYGGTGRNNANGVDADGGSLTTEFATEILNPYGNFIIYGMTAGMLEPAWTYSHDLGEGKRRMAFAGSLAMKVFNQIARLNGTVQIMPSQTSFGFQFTEFRFYKGSIIMVEHPLLNGISGMTGLCIGVDMPAFRIAYMEGRDTKPEEYGGTGRNNANGVDADGGSLTTEFATEILNPYGNFIIYGMTAGAAG